MSNTCDSHTCARRMSCYRYRAVIDPDNVPWVDRWSGGDDCRGFIQIVAASLVVTKHEADERRTLGSGRGVAA